MVSYYTKFAIYAHYSLDTHVMRHSWLYLESLISLGFRIIFVSNSKICIGDLNLLADKNIVVIIRENIGLDFGMWKDALNTVKLEEIDELLLTNSSIMGPFSPLAPIFEKASQWRCDFWGITDNTELAPHLQSYFIVLKKRVLQSKVFTEFWNSVLPYHSKNQIIRSYEIGLTVWLEEHGFTWRPLIAQSEVWTAYTSRRGVLKKLSDRICKRNPYLENVTLSYPELLISMGCPFIKNSLLETGSSTITQLQAKNLLERAKGRSESI